MSEIDNVISCLKKVRKKSLGQNKENLTNYLVKNYVYDNVNATELIGRVVEDEAVKIVQFNGQDSYRIIAKDDTRILAPDTQSAELESSDCISERECRQIINKTAVEKPTPNSEAVEKFFKDFPANTDKLQHNCRNFEELNSSCDADFPLKQCNKKKSKKRENVIIIGDSC